MKGEGDALGMTEKKYMNPEKPYKNRLAQSNRLASLQSQKLVSSTARPARARPASG